MKNRGGNKSEEQAELIRLTELFRQYGADNPEYWAKAELWKREGIPQLARFSFLKSIASELLKDNETGWVDTMINSGKGEKPGTPLSQITGALEEMLGKNVSRESIIDLVRVVQFETLFHVCSVLDGDTNEDVPVKRFSLFAVNENDEPTDQLRCIHEDLLSYDPSGREMRPRIKEENKKITIDRTDQMRIFIVRNDNVQALNSAKDNYPDLFDFNGTPKFIKWSNLKPRMYITTPNFPECDFFNLTIGSLAFNEKALKICKPVFENAGEILLAEVWEHETLYVLNVLKINDCLDHDKSVWYYYNDGTRGRILDFKFIQDKIDRSASIFKIPETASNTIYCFANVLKREEEFYYVYHDNHLTGLKFEEIFPF